MRIDVGAAQAVDAGGDAPGKLDVRLGPSNASETIARLQADGNRVIVNKVGNGAMDQCSVTSVRPIQTNPLPTGNPLTGVPNLQRQTTVHVGLKC